MQNSVLNNLFYSTVLIEAIKGISGTGFLVSANKGVDNNIFLVTNRHVVEQNTLFSLTFSIADEQNNIIPNSTRSVELALSATAYQNKSIDLAIINLTETIRQIKNIHNINLYIFPIPIEKIASKDEYNNIEVLQRVIYYGYPACIKNPETNLPLVRSGHLASILHNEFNYEPVFLVDGIFTLGSSGSPIIILEKENSSFILIGIAFAEIINNRQETIGLGKALKGYLIKDLIEATLG